MPNRVRIALDAMGGDVGAAVVVPGAELSLLRHPNIEFLLFGNAAAVEPLLDAHPRLKPAARVVHTDVAVRMDDKPSQALRRGRWRSSIHIQWHQVPNMNLLDQRSHHGQQTHQQVKAYARQKNDGA